MKKHIALSVDKVTMLILVICILGLIIIPSWITKYQQKITVEKLKTAYSNIEQVIKMSQINNEELKAWQFTNIDEEAFAKKYLLPYIKGVKIIESKPPVVRPLGAPTKISNNSDIPDKYYEFANGTFFTLVLPEEDNGIVLEMNVFLSKDKEYVMGHNVFKFVITQEREKKLFGLYRSTTDRKALLDKDYESDGKTDNCAKTSNEYSGDSCGYLIMIDGWKIKNDYPW